MNSMTIPSTGLCLTERQIYGIMTNNFTQTVELQGWDAFKDFVITILNSLPYVHISTKKEECEALLHELFPDYANNQSSVNDLLSMFSNLKTLWSYMEEKAANSRGIYALTMASDPDNHRVAFCFYPQQDHEVDWRQPAVSLECAVSDADLAIFSDITEAFMTPENEGNSFTFDVGKMNENCVAFAQIRRKYNLWQQVYAAMPSCQLAYPNHPYDTLQPLSTEVIAALSEILKLNASSAPLIKTLLPTLADNSNAMAQQIKSDTTEIIQKWANIIRNCKCILSFETSSKDTCGSLHAILTIPKKLRDILLPEAALKPIDDLEKIEAVIRQLETAERELTSNSMISNDIERTVTKSFIDLGDSYPIMKEALERCWQEIQGKEASLWSDQGKTQQPITDLDAESIRSFNIDPQYVTATVTIHPLPENSDEIGIRGGAFASVSDQEKKSPSTFASVEAAIASGLKAQRLQEARPALEKALTQMKSSTQFWQDLSNDEIYNLLGEAIDLLEHCIALEPLQDRDSPGIHRNYETLKGLIQSQTQGKNQNSLLKNLKALPAEIPGFNRQNVKKRLNVLNPRTISNRLAIHWGESK